MENSTSVPKEFHIWPFSFSTQSPAFILALFTVIYLLGVLLNVLIVTLIYLDKQLHSPMYLFLCNLSFVDICYTTTVIPKLLHMLSSGNHKVSFRQCFTQIFFFFLAAGTEDLLLFIMAYDRYVAICKPLHYRSILSNKVCSICMATIWFCAALNSFAITVPTMKMSFCHSTTIHHFYCDAKALTKISCAGKELFYLVIYFELFFFGLCPLLCSFTSYAKILQVIYQIKSRDGRKKAFSTCSSHLTVILLYYSTAALVYLLPSSKYSDILDQFFTLLYATVTPMVNPLIYSLRNKEVKTAVMKLLQFNPIMFLRSTFLS
ncbi:olfactory receptor-like protein OLF4 [Leptodactylus fuscus]|uniref:olfactory receptor-like protein OLF4 n=1 Tax=Leptodactylus fuscus TaxID=238119 RepID=UPI003F4EA1C9